jgi:50S ribosomal protein L16 3-hydroxylase
MRGLIVERIRNGIPGGNHASSSYNVGMKNQTVLGDITPARFLRDYWHKKPLLIRRALPEFQPLLSREALFDMAARDDVESRLITHFKKKWQMESRPIGKLPPITRKEWTLLVQGVNLHNDAADALLRQFRFIPDARLDDLMISYATDAGSVGPHFDSYDVFLLQAHGQRRWRIGAQTDLSLLENVPLKILRHFKPEQEFVLEPGDMLYLPPHYAHEGVALGECMTYSIGFRAPSYQELGGAFLQFMADTIDLPGRYADPALTVSKRPAEISRPMLSQVAAQLAKVEFTRDDIAIFLGEYLSEPKAAVVFERPALAMTLVRFKQAAIKSGVKLSRKTQMLYSGKHTFINGESFAVERGDRGVLATLADRRELDGVGVAQASQDVMEALYAWRQDGWLDLATLR